VEGEVPFARGTVDLQGDRLAGVDPMVDLVARPFCLRPVFDPGDEIAGVDAAAFGRAAGDDAGDAPPSSETARGR
jgi:hypothetical protein